MREALYNEKTFKIRPPYAIWAALVWGLSILPIFATIYYPRVFNQDGLYLTSVATSGPSVLVGRGILTISLGLGVLGVGYALRRFCLRRRGFGIWIGSMAVASGAVAAGFFGSNPSLPLEFIVFVFVFSALYLLPTVRLEWLVRHLMRVILLYAYGSLLAATLAPDWALQYSYEEGIVPGFDVRLHGVANHANILAPLLLFYLVLERCMTMKRTLVTRVHMVVVLACLFLTQSKTVWILLFVSWVSWNLFSLRKHTRMRQRLSFALLLGGMAVGGIALFLTAPDNTNQIPIIAQNSGYSISTLSGRTPIWAATIEVWREDVWFGYGPNLWDQAMRLRYEPLVGFAPGHAHNQFLQTLGSAGIIGALSLLAYSVILCIYGVRYARFTKGASLILVYVLLIRGFTEPFIRNDGISNGNFFIHFVVFSLLLTIAGNAKRVADDAHENNTTTPTAGRRFPLTRIHATTAK